MSFPRIVLVLIGVTVLANPAYAHPGHLESSFSSGLAHPLQGWDHLLASLAIGLWAAKLGGRALWVLPLTFLGFIAAGTALGRTVVNLPALEPVLAASVLVLGLCLCRVVRSSMSLSVSLTALFALFHGHAHGLHTSAASSWLPYFTGLLTTTLMLCAVGLSPGLAATRLNHPSVFRYIGGVIIAAGMIFCLT